MSHPQKLTDVIASSAFTVMDAYIDNHIAFVSGDYVTLGWVEGEDVFLDETGPWQHGLGRDGLYGAEASEIYDKAREMIRQAATQEEE